MYQYNSACYAISVSLLPCWNGMTVTFSMMEHDLTIWAPTGVHPSTKDMLWSVSSMITDN